MQTDSLRAQRRLIAEQREQDYYNYELYQELTDQSERLAAPMDNEFEYVVTADGLAAKLEADGRVEYVPVRPMLEAGVEAARQALVHHPEWQFELNRRVLELEEWDKIEAFTLGELKAHELVVFSPYPDNVPASIDGYDRTRKRTMVRRIRRSDNGVKIRSCSLDQTDHAALQAAAAAIGHQLPLNEGSEAVLAARCWRRAPLPGNKDAIDAVRDAYDSALAARHGGEWYAGRRPMSVDDALAFIKEQPDLIERHIQAVRQVKAAVAGREREVQLEHLRYDFAATLDKRLRGEHVDAGDMAAVGETARADGMSFDGECPTLGGDAEAQIATQGYGREILCTCPFCHKKVRVDPCASKIKCPNKECKAEVANGKVVSRGQAEKKIGIIALKKVIPSPKVPTPLQEVKKPTVGDVTKMNGHTVRLVQRLVIGGAKRQWVDEVTGEVVKAA